jgi:hypothetical protein
MSDWPKSYFYRHQLSEKPEYLQAMGLVSVEINGLEIAFAEMLAGILMIGSQAARAIYFAPNSNFVRLSILEGANLALADNVMLQAKVAFVISKAKGITTRRHEMIHHQWSVDPETNEVHRQHIRRDVDFSAKPIQLEVLTDISRDIKALLDETLVIVVKLKQFRGVQFPSPDTMPELIEWIRQNQIPQDFLEQRKLEAPPPPPQG